MAFRRFRAIIGAMDFYILEVSEGQAVGGPRHFPSIPSGAGSHAWTPDGRGIIFYYSGRFWEVALEEGAEPQMLPYAGSQPAISSRGNLVYSQRTQNLNIWEVKLARPGVEPGPPERLIYSTFNDSVPYYSPDGTQIAFTSRRTGYNEIYVCDREVRNRLPLTRFQGLSVSTNGWSPDGEWILFTNFGTNRNIYVISPQGTGQRPLTTHPAVNREPSFSRDGKWVYFVSDRSGEEQVWKIPFEAGGEPIQVTHHSGGPCYYPQESFDGKVIYYALGETIWQKPVDGGEETQVLDTMLKQGSMFSLTRGGIYFLPRETPGISFYDFKTKSVWPVISN